ncbi:Calcium-binding EF-hand [Olea europaea subsp. europaea]|uniref:Calcium-binding EF-hand n=1 Tax=Olea europaea subsp. europaea TaxID=158383 RepID=A0A8S0S2I8_OLEEU|nr:Calcium-binding EF-hand [Olea europaea subsp. europaea]
MSSLTCSMRMKLSGKPSSKEFELQVKEDNENLYDVLFERFDVDKSDTIEWNDLTILMKEIMVAKARSIGNFASFNNSTSFALEMKKLRHFYIIKYLTIES